MRVLCWALLAISATATGATWWAARHYQSVAIVIVASYWCWMTYQCVLAVIEAHRLTCSRCKRWQPELTASGYCEGCFWQAIEEQPVQPIEIKHGDVRAEITPINDARGLWRVEIWSDTIGRAGSHTQAYGSPERCLRFVMDWAEATADATK